MGAEGTVEESDRFIVLKRCFREAVVEVVQANAHA
jgi:hypothetical protein